MFSKIIKWFNTLIIDAVVMAPAIFVLAGYSGTALDTACSLYGIVFGILFFVIAIVNYFLMMGEPLILKECKSKECRLIQTPGKYYKIYSQLSDIAIGLLLFFANCMTGLSFFILAKVTYNAFKVNYKEYKEEQNALES